MDKLHLGPSRCSLAASPELWRFGLLSSRQLGQYARDRGISTLGMDAVEALWRVGLLRCDALTADEALEIDSLECVSEVDGKFLYCDKRRVPHRSEGTGGVFAVAGEDMPSLDLHFHPFRLYVLYHIHRVFMFTPTATQYLLNPTGLPSFAERHIAMLDKWTSGLQSVERFEHWNTASELAIVLEPVSYERVLCEIPEHPAERGDESAAALGRHREAVNDLLEVASNDDIEEIRGELCRAAELLDANKLVHVLLRLMASHERLKLRGALGGCMLFLCMAETIRRAAEDFCGVQLPEEDALGFGQWMDGARSLLYGTERILDARPETQRDFLTSMGLDRGVKVRCYVEGPTELGALRSAVGEGGGIQFINLRGQVLEKRGKGLSFVESLESDRDSGVFSVVVLDGDREDYVRALRKAAREDAFFGVFTISSPDFEFCNFTAEELLSVWLEFSSRDTEEKPDMPDDKTPLEEVASVEQFTDYLCRGNFPAFEKSEAWGEALIAYALENEGLPDGHARAGEIRPIVLLARQLMTARHAGYERSVAQFRVDADTGGLIRRDA